MYNGTGTILMFEHVYFNNIVDNIQEYFYNYFYQKIVENRNLQCETHVITHETF